MKKLVFILMLAALFACKSTENKAEEELNNYLSQFSSVKYMHKLDGLENQAALDTIWKLIFRVPGIEQIIVSKDDSLLTVVFEPDSLTLNELVLAVERTGIKITESQFTGGKSK